MLTKAEQVLAGYTEGDTTYGETLQMATWAAISVTHTAVATLYFFADLSILADSGTLLSARHATVVKDLS